MKGEKTFCPIPWIFQAARSNGDVRVCCQANVTKNKGVVRKTDGTAYNVAVDDLSEARNAELMNTIRKNMLSSKWNEECGRCKQEEENNLTSRRQYERVQWKYSILDALKNTNSDGSIDTNKSPIRYYDLRFGNFCNLKCRMCGPSDSDAWYSDWIELTGKTSFSDTSGEVQIQKVGNKLTATDFDWPNSEMFWTQIERNIPNIEHVYFAGGEPMLIERHYEFLQKCIDTDNAKNILVEYNTNMTTLPPRVIKLWKEFKEVRIGASIDGMEAVLEYQRYPVKWNKVRKNLDTLDTLPKNIKAWIAFTVTAYNVEHMIDFMKWKLQESNWIKINSSAIKPIITYHVAHHPQNLNIRVLPDAHKDRITQKFDNFVQWVETQNLDKKYAISAKGIRNGVCNYMNSDSYHEKHWNEFVSYTQSLDKIRFESINNSIPSIAALISNVEYKN